MKSIKKSYAIKTSVEKVWDALVNPDIIKKWGGGPVKMDAKTETKFSLWGGDVEGKNLEVTPNKLLKQEWQERDWDTPSILTFKLSEKEGITTVDLLQINIPENKAKDIESGWDEYYMVPLKELVENE